AGGSDQVAHRAEEAPGKAQPDPEPVKEEPVVDEPAPLVELSIAAADPVAEPEPEPLGTKSYEDAAVSGSDPVTHLAQEAPVESEPVAADAVWTKEVSSSRAPAEPETAPEPEPVAEASPVEAEPVAADAVWTKEVSFSRAPTQPQTAAPEPEPVAEAPPAAEPAWTE